MEEPLLENHVQAPPGLSAASALQALPVLGCFLRLFRSKRSRLMQICCFNSSNSPAGFSGAGLEHGECFRTKMWNGSRIWEVPAMSQLCPQTSCVPDVAVECSRASSLAGKTCRSSRRCFILGLSSTKEWWWCPGGSAGLSLPRGHFLEWGTYRIVEQFWLEEIVEIIKSPVVLAETLNQIVLWWGDPAETCVLVSS